MCRPRCACDNRDALPDAARQPAASRGYGAATTRPLLCLRSPGVLKDHCRLWPTVGDPPNVSNSPILVNFPRSAFADLPGSPGAYACDLLDLRARCEHSATLPPCLILALRSIPFANPRFLS